MPSVWTKDHIVTRGSIAAECHSTTGEKLKATILDKQGDGAKQTSPDKFKVRVNTHLSFVAFCLFFFQRQDNSEKSNMRNIVWKCGSLEISGMIDLTFVKLYPQKNDF